MLHRRPYSDNSFIVECFTPVGRFPAMSRAALSNKRRGSSALQPFAPLIVQWKGKGEVVSLIGHEQASQPHVLVGTALYCGFYLNELLMRLLPRNDSCPEIFSAYDETLGQLSSGANPDPWLRRFELHLLDSLGYGLDFAHTLDSGDSVQAEKRYKIIVEQGVVNAENASAPSYSGEVLLALHRGEEMAPGLWPEARQLTRYILNHYLGPVPLKSRELFRKT